jgi:hypothetical protein
MHQETLNEILRKHALWLNHESGGERADLIDADLRDADLRDADLRDADLCGADLRDADLRCADLRDADLCGADLSGANLRGADLRDADLSGANLRGADLSGADLLGANLSRANLHSVKGLLLLPVQDYRGYSWPHAVECRDGLWRIRAGCRFFTIAEARDHWGASYKGDRELGDMYLYAVEWLESKIAAAPGAGGGE